MNNDLISREALKKAFNKWWGCDDIPTTIVEDLIDDAPTVPLPDFKEGYKQAIIDGKTNFSRPQGEWGKHGECPFCSYIRQCEEDNFCGNCGADLRKGGAEE